MMVLFLKHVSYNIKLPGRSGRAGRSGQAVTFYTEDDVPLLRSVAHVIFASGGDVPEWMLNLPKVHKHKFKPHTSGVSSASEISKNKPQSKPPQKSRGRKPEGFKNPKDSTRQENGMPKNSKASSKKTLPKKNTKSSEEGISG